MLFYFNVRQFLFTCTSLPLKEKLTCPPSAWCEEAQHQPSCRRDAAPRSFSATWGTPKTVAAVHKGHLIEKIYKFGTLSGKTGIFRKYFDKFLKIKTEASGWLCDGLTELKKSSYTSNHQCGERILLERGKIEQGSGVRSLAKLCLNR